MVVEPDATVAQEIRAWLLAAGIPAVIPGDVGLQRRTALGASPFGQPPFEMNTHGMEETAFWAGAVRRPAIAVREDHVTIAWSRDSWEGTDRDGAIESLLEPRERARPPRVAAFGGAWVNEDEPEYTEAQRFAHLCAESRIEIVNGGYGGIMAAVSRGAASAGGTAVGVTIGSFTERVPVNRWLSYDVEAADLFARLPLICDAEAWVAFPGGVGTLSEVSLVWSLVQTETIPARPLIIVGERWDEALHAFRQLLRAETVHFDLVRPAASAEDAFALVENLEGALPRDHVTEIEGFELLRDTAPADWAIDRLDRAIRTREWKVSSRIPEGFEAYARIDHPDREGSLPDEQFGALAGLLAPFTTSSGSSYVGIWEGWGVMDTGTRVPKVHLGGGFGGAYRSYVLFHGPVEPTPRLKVSPPWYQSPNMWWPEDRAWFLATEIDDPFTFVGGTRACIEKILADPRFDARPTRPDSPT